MKKIKYFDYLSLAQEMEVPKDILREIEREVKSEFPSDTMMYELHVLRAIRSGYWREMVEGKKNPKPLKAVS